ncbi:MAG: hypothetical protein P4L93_10035 [Coriobacteriia bacterium]|nr:hypothetical protein [Coriobacteriia bacterium]
MPLWFRIIRIWLPIAVAVTAVSGLTYLAVQQSYRNGLDDPQQQLATDGAALLDAGATPESVATSPTIDAAMSLAPFVVVVGPQDNVLASGATIGSSVAEPPAGVLAAARAQGTDRVTWQPQTGVRIASVSAAAKDGRVVIAGRNMRAVEARIDDLGRITALAWGAALIGVLIATFLTEYLGLRLERSA